MDHQKSIAVVRVHHMLAMLNIVSYEAARLYLGGVYIEPHKEGGAVLTATNGSLLISIYDPEAYCLGEPKIWRIKEFAKQIKILDASFGKNYCENWLRYEEAGEPPKRSYRLAYCAGMDPKASKIAQFDWDSPLCPQITSRDADIVGPFPNWGKVIAQMKETRSGTTLNSQLLQKISKFAEEFANKKEVPIGLEFCDDNDPGHFRVRSEKLEAIGVIMPWRDPASFYHHPAWLAHHLDRPELGAPAPAEMPEAAKKKAA